MKSYYIDNGMNRVIFTRDEVVVEMGEEIQQPEMDRLSKSGYVEAAEKYLEKNPSIKLVVVEWREVKFAVK